MKNFEFCSPTRIIFGRGTEESVGKETRKYGSRILLHYGGGSIKKTGLYDRVIASLKDEGIEILELGGVQPNPRLELVRKGIAMCRKENVDFVLVVGGGSAIDSGKAIAAGVPYDGDVWDFFSNKKAAVDKVLPLGTVLTIPAAGSEASNGMVITREEGLYKRPAISENLRPMFSILNPELTFTLSVKQTVTGVSDILAHIYERYFTKTRHTDLTDRLSEATMKSVINNTELVLNNLDDYNARAEIMWSGTLAHNDLLGTGRESDWGSHDMEHELSAIYDISHGEGLSIIFPAWMKYVYRDNIEKFAQFAVRVWNVDLDFDNMEKTVLEGINHMESFYKKVGLPVRLKDLGIGNDRLEEMAAKAVKDGPLGQFRKLNKEDIVQIYNLALE